MAVGGDLVAPGAARVKQGEKGVIIQVRRCFFETQCQLQVGMLF